MNEGEIKVYYTDEICEAIYECARDREVGAARLDGSYLARPAMLAYPADVRAMVQQGTVSFHGSIERWSQPMRLATGLPKKELDALRTGWDFVIDLDCDKGLEYAKLGAEIFLGVLEQHGIKQTSIKFSGNRGFHIGVPFDVFPEEIDGKPTSSQYPALPKKIAEYLKEYARPSLVKALESFVDEKDAKAKAFNPYSYIDVDIGVFSSRHLFRMPYCLHHKTWLASIPIKRSQIMGFDREQAKPGNFDTSLKYLERKKGDASKLVRKTLFWYQNERQETETEFKDFKPLGEAINSDFFPPCMKNILKGVSDGRKRSVFVLTTFLMNMGWKPEDVRMLLIKWNEKNQEPLSEAILLYTLRDQIRRGKPLMCPNCNAENYYKAYGVCMPVRLCANIKNPAGFTLAKRKEKGKGRRGGKGAEKGKGGGKEVAGGRKEGKREARKEGEKEEKSGSKSNGGKK